MRIHLIGNFIVPTNPKITSCAYNQTLFKYSSALKEAGFKVIVYGTKEFKGTFECDKFYYNSTLSDYLRGDITKDNYVEFYSDGPYLSYMKDKNYSNYLNLLLIKRTIKLFKRSVRKGDILLYFYSPYFYSLYDTFERKGGVTVEGLVQGGIFKHMKSHKRYSIFASKFMMEQRNEHLGAPGQGVIQRVIPPFFDPEDFIYNKPEPSPYTYFNNIAAYSAVGDLSWISKYESVQPKPKKGYLYLARIQYLKGFYIFLQIVRKFPMEHFMFAGFVHREGDIFTYDEESFDIKDFPNLEYLGLLDKKGRALAFTRTIALIQPTVYSEPFGWNVIEANLSGVPVITSNWGAFKETVINGYNGYRVGFRDENGVNYGYRDEWVKALQGCKSLNPENCRNHGLRYSRENVMKDYISFLKEVSS